MGGWGLLPWRMLQLHLGLRGGPPLAQATFVTWPGGGCPPAPATMHSSPGAALRQPPLQLTVWGAGVCASLRMLFSCVETKLDPEAVRLLEAPRAWEHPSSSSRRVVSVLGGCVVDCNP